MTPAAWIAVGLMLWVIALYLSLIWLYDRLVRIREERDQLYDRCHAMETLVHEYALMVGETLKQSDRMARKALEVAR